MWDTDFGKEAWTGILVGAKKKTLASQGMFGEVRVQAGSTCISFEKGAPLLLPPFENKVITREGSCHLH